MSSDNNTLTFDVNTLINEVCPNLYQANKDTINAAEIITDIIIPDDFEYSDELAGMANKIADMV